MCQESVYRFLERCIAGESLPQFKSSQWNPDFKGATGRLSISGTCFVSFADIADDFRRLVVSSQSKRDRLGEVSHPAAKKEQLTLCSPELRWKLGYD
jgi:hypothetical protein